MGEEAFFWKIEKLKLIFLLLIDRKYYISFLVLSVSYMYYTYVCLTLYAAVSPALLQ